MSGDHLDQNTGRSLAAEILFGGVKDGRRILIGHEAEGELCKGFFREDSLGSRALIAATDSVDLGRGSGTNPLDCGEALLPGQFGDTR